MWFSGGVWVCHSTIAIPLILIIIRFEINISHNKKNKNKIEENLKQDPAEEIIFQ